MQLPLPACLRSSGGLLPPTLGGWGRDALRHRPTMSYVMPQSIPFGVLRVFRPIRSGHPDSHLAAGSQNVGPLSPFHALAWSVSGLGYPPRFASHEGRLAGPLTAQYLLRGRPGCRSPVRPGKRRPTASAPASSQFKTPLERCPVGEGETEYGAGGESGDYFFQDPAERLGFGKKISPFAPCFRHKTGPNRQQRVQLGRRFSGNL